MLHRSIAIVIGPTPPGTGVSSPRGSLRPGSTSPTSPSSVRVIPTSTTAAPCFHHLGRTIPGTPTAATSTSAARVCAARSTRARVADRHRRVPGQEEQRDGLADDGAAADHDGARALERHVVLVEQRQHPERRRRHERGRPASSSPALNGMEAVDVLDRVEARITCASSMVRQRQLDEDAVDRVVGVQLARRARGAPPRSSRRQALVARVDPDLAAPCA